MFLQAVTHQCSYHGTCLQREDGLQSRFSPFTVWVLGIKLQLSGGAPQHLFVGFLDGELSLPLRVTSNLGYSLYSSSLDVQI